MKAYILAGAALLALAGCMRDVEITSRFDPREVSYINARGSATISGQAFLRQQGGGVVTCAGEEVSLIPAGQYARERISGIYGSPTGGYNNIYDFVNIDDQSAEYQEYVRLSRRARCDANGNFEFTGVANGDYYVVSAVRWAVGYTMQGGTLAQLVRVRNGQSQRILLSS